MKNKGNLESNKIFASILLAGLIAMLAGFVTKQLYPNHADEVRGYQIEVAEENTESANLQEEAEEVIDIPSLMASASAEEGAKVAKKCAACHNFKAGEPHKVGPNLHDIINNQIAAKPGYAYSSALSEVDKKWTYEEIFHFLKSPKKYAPGTKMTFAGLKKPQDIANMIEFLRSN